MCYLGSAANLRWCGATGLVVDPKDVGRLCHNKVAWGNAQVFTIHHSHAEILGAGGLLRVDELILFACEVVKFDLPVWLNRDCVLGVGHGDDAVVTEDPEGAPLRELKGWRAIVTVPDWELLLAVGD